MYKLVNNLKKIPNIKYVQQPPDEIIENLDGNKKMATRKMIDRFFNYSEKMNYSRNIFYFSLSEHFPYMDKENQNYVIDLCKNLHSPNGNCIVPINDVRTIEITERKVDSV